MSRFGHHALVLRCDTSTRNEIASPSFLASVLSLAPNIKSLGLVGRLAFENDDDENWRQNLLPQLAHLEFLSLKVFFGPEACVQFGRPLFQKYGSQLKAIEFEGYLLESDEISGGYLTQLFPNLRGLRVCDVGIDELNKLLDADWELESLQIVNNEAYEHDYEDENDDELQWEFEGVWRVAGKFGNSLVELNLQCRLFDYEEMRVPEERIVFTPLKKVTMTIQLDRPVREESENWLSWLWNWLTESCPVLEEINFEMERVDEMLRANVDLSQLEETYRTVSRRGFERMDAGEQQELKKIVWFDVKSGNKVVMKRAI